MCAEYKKLGSLLTAEFFNLVRKYRDILWNGQCNSVIAAILVSHNGVLCDVSSAVRVRGACYLVNKVHIVGGGGNVAAVNKVAVCALNCIPLDNIFG